VQDAAAALPARLLGDVRGKTVADLCAAPGGKTAQLVQAGAHVTAIDRSPARLARLRDNLERLQLEAATVVSDAVEWKGADGFDGILVDAPCSSTGTIRRHPDIAWLRQEADIAPLVALQKRLLQKAAALLKPGGTLVYCSCSLEPEEGEQAIATLLASEPALRRVPIEASEVADLAEIVYVDRYGNALTGLRGEIVATSARFSVGGELLAHANTFSTVPRGTAFWYVNSNGLVEIAVNQGRADRQLGLTVGASVAIVN